MLFGFIDLLFNLIFSFTPSFSIININPLFTSSFFYEAASDLAAYDLAATE